MEKYGAERRRPALPGDLRARGRGGAAGRRQALRPREAQTYENHWNCGKTQDFENLVFVDFCYKRQEIYVLYCTIYRRLPTRWDRAGALEEVHLPVDQMRRPIDMIGDPKYVRLPIRMIAWSSRNEPQKTRRVRLMPTTRSSSEMQVQVPESGSDAWAPHALFEELTTKDLERARKVPPVVPSLHELQSLCTLDDSRNATSLRRGTVAAG